jgi:hypothetical protein
MERSLKIAVTRLIKQLLTLSFLLFIFQSKVIGSYVVNELRTGGAVYVSTGRGLPTDRRPFIGEPEGRGFKLKKVGGLYLDYAAVAYYDGAMLLGGCVLVLLAGGMSEAAKYHSDSTWTWISLTLVILSWLFAPFLFNPYQFVCKNFAADLRGWIAFFFEKGGKHWKEWYQARQLKMSGSRSSCLNISAFVMLFCLLTWFSAVSLKINALAILYSESVGTWVGGSMTNTHLLALAPPIGSSFVYAILMVVLASCCQCVFRWRKPTALPQTTSDASEQSQRWQCCNDGFPLALSAAFVLALDLTEAFYALQEFHWVGWQKALIAGLVLKLALLASCIHLAEIGLSRQAPSQCWYIHRVLELWVHAHRMSLDITVSSLIIFVLCPLVLLHTVNDSLCHGCNVHQLLIYRNTGQRRRDDVLVYKWFGEARRSMERSERSASRYTSERSARVSMQVSEREFSEARDDVEDVASTRED